MRRWPLALSIAVVLGTGGAWAEQAHVVSGSRILLGDLIPQAPADLQSVDLGPSPQPGAARFLRRDEIESLLRADGLDPSRVRIPDSMRVVGAKSELTPQTLVSLSRPSIDKALPKGVRLVSVRPPTHSITARPGTTIGRTDLGQLPRRAGQVQCSATVELVFEDRVVALVPVAVTLEVSEEAVRPDVRKGGPLRVVLEMGAVVVQAAGVALSDAKVGDTVMVSVTPTGKTVRAVLLEPTLAKVTGT